jgi:hypothetical protein
MHDWCRGFALIENWIAPWSCAEPRILDACRAALDTHPLVQTGHAINGRRRVARFGAYQGEGGDLPMPAWCAELALAIKECRPGWKPRNSVAINEYLPGDFIATHCDSFQYGDGIATLSLGAPGKFVLTGSGQTMRLMVPPRSLMILDGDAHWKCQHGIEPWPEQPGARYSIVFRDRVFGPPPP